LTNSKPQCTILWPQRLRKGDAMGKRKGGRREEQAPEKQADQHLHPRVAFHLEQELLAALDGYCEAHEMKPGRSDIIRLALRRFLQAEGRWPPKEK
jgi:hypothetical protein